MQPQQIQPQQIPLELIDPNPWQTRQKEDQAHVEEIAHSIKAMGMMQIPSARRVGERFELAFGHTRKAAFDMLNALGISDEYKYMPLIIVNLSDELMAVAAFEENEKRRDLTPVERARAVQRMLNSFNWTQEVVAEKIHIDRSGVSNMLRMLRLPDEVLESIEQGILPVRSAMALLPIFELSADEKYKLGERFGESYYDFLTVARTGEITSDAIRARVDFYMNFLRPEQLKLVDVETTEIRPEATTTDYTASPTDQDLSPIQIDPVVTATQTSISDWPGQKEGADQDGRDNPQAAESNQVVQETDAGSGQGALPVPDQTPAGTPSGMDVQPTPANEPGPSANTEVQKPAAPAAPAAKPEEPPDPNEILFTITYKTGAVIVGVRKPGMIIPTLKYLTELSPDDVPALMREMGVA